MAIKQILQFPHPTLAKVAEPVTEFNEEISQLSADLRETAAAFRAEGLAANQVDSLVRMFVIRDGTTNEYITCINPVILATQTDEVDSNEGCLSFPGVLERIKRHESVRVRFQDEGGVEVERWLTGVNAVAFQHELDHLNGIVFTAYMGKLQKRMALKKMEKVARHTKQNMARVEAMLKQQLHNFERSGRDSVNVG